jgi:hypothetical protein
MGVLKLKSFCKAGAWLAVLSFFSIVYGQPEAEDKLSLGEAFNAGAPEIEPIVVGRERWNEKPEPENLSEPQITEEINDSEDQDTKATDGRIIELDPLETQQVKPDPTALPLDPPKHIPATRIVRNFEGKLVFKPRNFGFANDFPYQLENSRGKRLAYIDVDQIKAIDPQQFVDQQINVMGKLEPVEEGSDDRVIRARIIRPSN